MKKMEETKNHHNHYLEISINILVCILQICFFSACAHTHTHFENKNNYTTHFNSMYTYYTYCF